MEYGKIVELAGKRLQGDIVVSDRHTFGVFSAAPIQSGQPQGVSDNGVYRVPVLYMKEIDSLAKYLSLMVRLDSQALSCVQPSQTLLQFAQDRFAHHGSEFAVPRR